MYTYGLRRLGDATAARQAAHRRIGSVVAGLLLAMSIVGCSATTVGGTSTTTPGAVAATHTPAAAACATHATINARAWVQGQQVFGEINNGPVGQLSNFVYPLGFPDEGAVGNKPAPEFMSWAPDGRHLAVAITQFAPFRTEYNPYIVDTQTHAVTHVPLTQPIMNASEPFSQRIFAWANSHTLIVFEGQSPATTYTYDINTNTVTPLPNMAGHAVEGVVRCSSLYYLTYGTFTSAPGGEYLTADGVLHRYDLTAQSEVGTPLTLGTVSTCKGCEGSTFAMGWDVSPDNSQLAYQRTTASSGCSSGSGYGYCITSHFFSGPTLGLFGTGASAGHPILNGGAGATANTATFMAISPNNQWVAVSNANDSPNVLSGSLAGGDLRAYSPDASGLPAWLDDSSGFQATHVDTVTYVTAIEQYGLNTPLGANNRAPGTQPYGTNNSLSASLSQ